MIESFLIKSFIQHCLTILAHILSLSLLDGLWAPLKLPAKLMASLIRMLNQFSLAITIHSRANADGERAVARMLVPAFLQQHLSVLAWPPQAEEGQLEATRWFLFSNGSAPAGLMSAIQVGMRCLQWS